MTKAFTLAGIAAPLVYLGTVMVGGWATPFYSHLHQPVSALFESGAPHAAPVSAAFVLYNLLLIVFALARTRLRPAAAMILLNGVFGLVIELTPMDPLGAPATFAGTAHLVIAGLLVVTCAAAMALYALAHAPLARPTWLLLAIMLASGAVAAMAAAQGWHYLGLAQRVTIGSYLIWLFALAVVTRRGSNWA